MKKSHVSIRELSIYTGVIPTPNEFGDWWKKSVDKMDKNLLEALKYNLQSTNNSVMKKMYGIVQTRLDSLNKY
ncbi:hypothetical protein BWGOE13_38460 [Bacillus mycoides]|uniref:Uncharacterized protein n=1 Tax=Bacillus mycoides TaxID=1405 RepID=A0A1E8BJ71_BACMY|nr:hypothetical protein [Bacillus mycoides]OFD89255.1 hypothetical protein BWGOE11_39190 [Bacillus mycoides]OFD95040.1 hypothetical protein BWGOE13_38460 [Bacillus mycoides]